MNEKINIVITGGGTGGHIYPGVALAEDIRSRYPQFQVHFVGAYGGLEEKIFPQTGFPYSLIQVGRLHSSVGRWQQIKTLLYLPVTFWQCVRIFLKLKPKAVLGVGGFASGPFLFTALLLGARTALWEANAQPGLTNRWLSRWVSRCYVVFAEAIKSLSSSHVKETGMPVRAEFFSPRQKSKTDKMKLLIFGGSQGAQAINNLVFQTLQKFPELFQMYQVTHQSGHRDYQRLKNQYQSLNHSLELLEYIHDMPAELQSADVVICRSGASTVAEVIVCRKPAIFIPLPTAADDHQFKNAKVLQDKKAALILEQKTATPEKLYEILSFLQKNEVQRHEMALRLSEYDFSKSSQQLVDDFIEGV